ncbi:hypothetical protein GNZ25_28600 [Burkholderia thailandensis]|nr:hypothetical protein A8H35_20480 [Burkholderia thailandensis]MUV25210.1 hypothetical protein [Burkholderia thailandensis]
MATTRVKMPLLHRLLQHACARNDVLPPRVAVSRAAGDRDSTRRASAAKPARAARGARQFARYVRRTACLSAGFRANLPAAAYNRATPRRAGPARPGDHIAVHLEKGRRRYGHAAASPASC